jgi:tetratricopeptide (TPR) repeat protein
MPGRCGLSCRSAGAAAGGRVGFGGDGGGGLDALPLQRRALAITKATLGLKHPYTAAALGNLACTYRALERPGDALPLQLRALLANEEALGPNHPNTATALENLASTYRALSRPGDALPLEKRAAQIRQRLR